MKNFNDLVKLADTLLGPQGCPWDKEQTLDSLKKYILEEANEVVEAIDNKDFENLKEELGDVLFNIVFMSKLAEQSKKFDINDVIENVTKKLIRRHPHIFGDKKASSAQEVKDIWSEMKKEEKRLKK